MSNSSHQPRLPMPDAPHAASAATQVQGAVKIEYYAVQRTQTNPRTGNIEKVQEICFDFLGTMFVVPGSAEALKQAPAYTPEMRRDVLRAADATAKLEPGTPSIDPPAAKAGVSAIAIANAIPR